MSELFYTFGIFVAGLALGTFFFGRLWFTVKKAMASKNPAVWFFCSFVLRMSLVMYGLYCISTLSWQLLLVAAVGFLVSRFVVTYFTKSLDDKGGLE